MTLYTDAKPGGFPAVRTGDSVPPPSPQPVSLSDMQNATAATKASIWPICGGLISPSTPTGRRLRATITQRCARALRCAGKYRARHRPLHRRARGHHGNAFAARHARAGRDAAGHRDFGPTLIVTFNPSRISGPGLFARDRARAGSYARAEEIVIVLLPPPQQEAGYFGSNPAFANSNFENSKPGATVHPASV